MRTFKLWFDVGLKRYTTKVASAQNAAGCGLMQDLKDIQQVLNQTTFAGVVV